jgi:hypothetical protein
MIEHIRINQSEIDNKDVSIPYGRDRIYDLISDTDRERTKKDLFTFTYAFGRVTDKAKSIVHKLLKQVSGDPEILARANPKDDPEILARANPKDDPEILARANPKDAQLIELYGKVFGSTLGDLTNRKCIFLCHGNMKSMTRLFDHLNRVLGLDYYQTTYDAFNKGEQKSIKNKTDTHLKGLQGKRVVVLTEMNDDELNDRLVQRLGMDPEIVVRQVNQKQVKFKANFVTFILASKMPRVGKLHHHVLSVPFPGNIDIDEVDNLSHALFQYWLDSYRDNIRGKGFILPDDLAMNQQSEMSELSINKSNSIDEAKMAIWFDRNKIHYQPQYTSKQLPNRRYDFRFHLCPGWINEADDRGHFEGNGHKERQESDRIKTLMAIIKGEKVIRIDYTQIDKIDYHMQRAFAANKSLYLSTPEMYTWLYLPITSTSIESEIDKRGTSAELRQLINVNLIDAMYQSDTANVAEFISMATIFVPPNQITYDQYLNWAKQQCKDPVDRAKFIDRILTSKFSSSQMKTIGHVLTDDDVLELIESK